MSAILITKGSKYECNLFWQVKNMNAIRSAQRDFRDYTHIVSLPEKIALIVGPFCNQDCTHIWTST